jgi:hypothetical protein
MDRVADVFWAISKNPLDYLSEPSLRALQHFLTGYGSRMRMEGEGGDPQLNYQGFQAWLDQHFSVHSGSRSVYLIVESYSAGHEDALRNFYKLYEEFCRSPRPDPGDSNPYQGPWPKQDIVELLRRIRHRPPLYLGHTHFFGIHAQLAGHERAGRDLRLPKTADETLFDSFKAWVENDKLSEGSPRPWFKRIEFCAFHDCGDSRASAYTVFYKLLDEFAYSINRPGLFEALSQWETK